MQTYIRFEQASKKGNIDTVYRREKKTYWRQKGRDIRGLQKRQK